MELKWMEAFVMVTEKGSFSAAAKSLYVSQSTVSSRILNLEQELDTILFVRNGGRRADLTPQGKKLYPFYKEAMRIVRQGHQSLSESDSPVRLRLSCPNHIGIKLLPSLLESLYQTFPMLQCEVHAGGSNQIMENVQNGTTDVGILFLHMTSINGDYTLQPITMEKTIIAASPKHPLHGKFPLRVRDLKNERFFVFSKGSHKFPVMDHFLRKNGLSAYNVSEIKNMEWIKMLLRNNQGIALLQRSIVEQELENGTLVELSLEEAPPSTPLSFIYRNDLPKEIPLFILSTLKRLTANDGVGPARNGYH